jgi:hypothetical protein
MEFSRIGKSEMPGAEAFKMPNRQAAAQFRKTIQL